MDGGLCTGDSLSIVLERATLLLLEALMRAVEGCLLPSSLQNERRYYYSERKVGLATFGIRRLGILELWVLEYKESATDWSAGDESQRECPHVPLFGPPGGNFYWKRSLLSRTFRII